ncbi:MAG: replication initiation protein [Hyphomicrobiales bacterium]
MTVASKKTAKQVVPKSSTEIVKKNVSAVHIGARLSLMQRKLVNAMLLNAYDTLVVEDTHSVNVSLLMEMIGFDSRNQQHLKTAIRGLTQKSVEWDIMEDDGTQVWEVSTLLSYASIRKGVCTYRYDKSLAEKLRNPDIYAKISLSVVREIRSVHALVLYENCYRYVNIGHTPKWDIDVFRKLMGVDTSVSYKQFKVLKRDVITPAIKEINKVSNIQIELETVMKGRTVVAVQFIIRPNKQLALLGLEPEDDVTSSRAYKALIECKIGKKWAYDLVVEHGEEYVLEKIELTDARMREGKIRSSKAAFLRSALQDDYHSDVAEKRQQKETVDAIRNARLKLGAELASAKKHLKKLEMLYREACLDRVTREVEKLEGDQLEATEEAFRSSLSSRIYTDDFTRSSWAGRLIFTDVYQFWEKRGVIFPGPDEMFVDGSAQTTSQVRARVKELESQLM